MASFLKIDADLRVEGLTVPELDRRLTEAYAKVLPATTPADVTVLVTHMAALAQRNVVVIGEVKRPGAVQITNPRLTLVDAIGLAGGPDTTSAKLSHLVLMRWVPELRLQKSWKIDARQERWVAPVPVYLQPYDVIYVPSTAVTKANLWIDQYIRRMIPLPGFFSPQVIGNL
jgi:protein involved in polysaccharide export with SLBB domain